MDPNHPDWKQHNLSDQGDDYVPLAEIAPGHSSQAHSAQPYSPQSQLNPHPNPVPSSQLAQPNPSRGGQMSGVFIGLGISLIIIMLILGGVVFYVASATREAARRVEKENREQRAASIQEAFGDGSASNADNNTSDDTSPISREEITAVFAKLKQAIKTESRNGFHSVFDVKEFAEEVQRKADFDLPRGGTWADLKKGVQIGLEKSYLDYLIQMDNDEVQISLIKPLDDTSRVMVFARFHYYELGASSKFRFWMHRSNQGVKIYDFEEIVTAFRTTDTVTNMLRESMLPNLSFANLNRLSAATNSLKQAKAAVFNGEFIKAKQMLAAIKFSQLPRPAKTMFHIFTAIIENNLENYDQALLACNKLQMSSPDSVIYLLLAANAHYGLENYAEAISNAEKFQEKVGVDSDALVCIGRSQLALGNFAAAIGSFQKSLDDNPNNYEAIYALATSLDYEKATAEVKQRFARVSNKKFVFETLAATFEADGQYYLIRPLIEAYQPDADADWQYAYYFALCANDQQQNQKALELLKPWLAKSWHIGFAFSDVCQQYARVARDIKSIEEIYLDIPNHEFAVMGLGHANIYDGERLLKLSDVHAENESKDKYWLYYRSRGLLLTDKANESFELLADHLPKIKSYTDRNDYYDTMIAAATQSGNSVAAYQKLGNKKETFTDVASRIAYKAKADELYALIQEHTKHHPTDIHLDYYKALLLGFNEKYSEALDTLLAVAEQRDAKETLGNVTGSLVDFAIKSDRLLDAYQQLTDKESFLGNLVYADIPESQTATLEKLAKLHEETAGETGNVVLLKIVRAIANKQWEQAFKEREKFNAIPTKDYDFGHWQITHAMYEAGEWEKALKLTQYDQQLIHNYAERFVNEQKNAHLPRLIEIAKQQNVPKQQVGLYEIAVLINDANHKTALEKLDSVDKSGDQFADVLWLYNGLIAECFIQLGQLDQLESMIKQSEVDDLYVPLDVALAIARGDEKAALAAASQWSDYWGEPIENLCKQRLIQATAKNAEAKQIIDAIQKSTGAVDQSPDE